MKQYDFNVSALLKEAPPNFLVYLFVGTTAALVVFHYVGKHLTCLFWGGEPSVWWSYSGTAVNLALCWYIWEGL